MSDNLKEEIAEFFKELELSNYEINAYLALSSSNFITAHEISNKSKVPSGRIYEILDELKNKGLIEIHESRPKKFKAIPPNIAFHKLISYISENSKKKITTLFNQAKNIESKLFDSEVSRNLGTSKIFWSTVFDKYIIMEMYLDYISNSKEEILITAFLNENTLKIIPLNRKLYKSFFEAMNRGVKIKILWSFEHDDRPLTEAQKNKDDEIYEKMMNILGNKSYFPPSNNNLEMKFVYKKLPTYYDIIDFNRIIMKLQNPLIPPQVFACISMLDRCKKSGQMSSLRRTTDRRDVRHIDDTKVVSCQCNITRST